MITFMSNQNGDMLQGKYPDMCHKGLFLVVPKNEDMLETLFWVFFLARPYVFLIFLNIAGNL